ncbi:hypothetical protein FKW77_005423 [Venturia effusa]|uniref:Uncharacterized protein n=1 Tax=Venturia effusa TaxID=50376 RepID=A0A517KWE3_9PEZI|nr:hypothetical protein FKW77_005423 [Venturia effusa]
MSGPAQTFTTISRYGPAYDQAYGHLAQAQQTACISPPLMILTLSFGALVAWGICVLLCSAIESLLQNSACSSFEQSTFCFDEQRSTLDQRAASSAVANTSITAAAAAATTTDSSSRPSSRTGSSVYDADDEKEIPARAAEKAKKKKEMGEEEKKKKRVACLPPAAKRAWMWREKKGIPHSQQQMDFAAWCERKGAP